MGTISVTISKSVDNGAYLRQNSGSQVKRYLQTNPGGSNPGAVDVGVDEVVVDFGSLTSPGFAKLENLSDEYDVAYGPTSGGVMVPVGILRKRVLTSGTETYGGGVGFIELYPGIELRLAIYYGDDESGSDSGSDSPLARIQIDAEDR